MRHKEPKRELVGPWRSLHAAVWMIGLAILFWKGWWWPGILVLVGISMIVEALLAQFVPQAFEGAQPQSAPTGAAAAPSDTQPRLELLPSSCPKCNAPVRGSEVRWTGPQSADCPYCGANLPIRGA